MATIKNGIIVSFSNTPQAEDDAFVFYKEQLLSWSLFNNQTDVLSLDVMANDLGGNSKTLYSVDDGINYLTDLLRQDVLSNGTSVWEASSGGDQIRINNGRVEIDLSHSIYALTGSTNISAMGAADRIIDTFTYAIRLGNGTLSWASVTIVVNGSNDAAAISGIASARLTEDANDAVIGDVTVTDPDYSESHTMVVANATSVGGLGTYSVNANGHWSYTLNNAAAQYLNAGQSTTDTFVVDSLDGTAHQTVTVTIAGANDIAHISGDASGSLVEDDYGPLTGIVVVSDPDSGQSHTQVVNNLGSMGALGVYSVDGNGHWTYTLNTAAVQYLGNGQSATDTFLIDSLDGTAHQLVTVTIAGADEA